MSVNSISGLAVNGAYFVNAAARLHAEKYLSSTSSQAAASAAAQSGVRSEAALEDLRAAAARMITAVSEDTDMAASMSDLARSQHNFAMLAATYSASIRDGGAATAAIRSLML